MIARATRRKAIGRRLIGWIAAYAFVLHAVFAAAVGVQIAANAAAGFELCLDHPDNAPGPAQGQHQHDQCAQHCAAFAGLATLTLALIAVVLPPRAIGYAPKRGDGLTLAFASRAGRSRAPPMPA